jgi:hypothetical protein
MIRDLIALDNSSKVWIYQADRDFSYDELDEARNYIFQFLDSWTSHNQALLTYGNIFHRRFLVFFVDESLSGASGCSIDKSVHFVESLGQHFKLDFFQRTSFAYMENDEIFFIEKSDLKMAYSENRINENTLFFNHLVQTKGDFLKKWIQPLNSTWHYRFVK